MTTTAWMAIALLTVGTVAIKAVGPIAFGGRELSPRASAVIARLAPSLLAALVVVDTFGGTDRTLSVDATAVGLRTAADGGRHRDCGGRHGGSSGTRVRVHTGRSRNVRSAGRDSAGGKSTFGAWAFPDSRTQSSTASASCSTSS